MTILEAPATFPTVGNEPTCRGSDERNNSRGKDNGKLSNRRKHHSGVHSCADYFGNKNGRNHDPNFTLPETGKCQSTPKAMPITFTTTKTNSTRIQQSQSPASRSLCSRTSPNLIGRTNSQPKIPSLMNIAQLRRSLFRTSQWISPTKWILN
jgi:hypothetical protein